MKKNILFLFCLLMFVVCLFGCGKTYTVTFVYNNGQENTSVEVKDASEIELPAASKEGYNFGGWYLDSEGKTLFTEHYKLEDNITLYAYWKLKEFDVNFYVNEVLINSQKVKYGEDATEPNALFDEKYEFKGWDKEFTNVKKNLSVNAILEVTKFTVVFMKDTQVLKSEEVEYGSSATAPEDPKKEGYNFKNWDKEFNEVKSNLIVNAVFEAKTYDIKYYDGTTELDLQPKKLTYGEAFDCPTFTADGFVFAGWFTDSAYQLKYNPGEAVNSDLDLYALLIKIDYNGGSNTWRVNAWDDTNTVTKGLNGVSSLPAEYEKDFYQYLSDEGLLNDSRLGEGLSVSSFEEFSSVNKLHDGDPQRVWNDTVLTKADATSCGYSSLFLYESMELDENGVLVDVQGGFLGTEPYKTKYFNLVQQLTVLYNSKYNVAFTSASPTACQLFAYVIDGYFYGPQGVSASSKADFAAFRTAVPTPTKYYTWDGTQAVEHTREYVFTTDTSSLEASLAVPFYEGKTFKGWYVDSACTQSLSDATITSRMTIYAKWE